VHPPVHPDVSSGTVAGNPPDDSVIDAEPTDPSVPVLPPPPPDAPSLSTIVAATGTGSNETSGSVAMSLVDGIRFATEVRELEELCVGETYRLTNQMDAALKDRMYEIKSNDPLTIAVTDSVGNGVAGLTVSGAITKSRDQYTMIFRTNVTSEEYQYNFLLYGRKKVEVYCKSIQLLSVEGVLIKPAPRLRPPTAFAFYDAADNTRVTSGGTVLISSRDDHCSQPLVFPTQAPISACLSTYLTV